MNSLHHRVTPSSTTISTEGTRESRSRVPPFHTGGQTENKHTNKPKNGKGKEKENKRQRQEKNTEEQVSDGDSLISDGQAGQQKKKKPLRLDMNRTSQEERGDKRSKGSPVSSFFDHFPPPAAARLQSPFVYWKQPTSCLE